MDNRALALEEREFLLSEAYRQYLERVVRTVSGMYDVQVVFSQHIQTDGKVIHINPLSPLLSPLPKLEQKTLAILGQLAHEYFHIAYTDFRVFRLLPAKMRRESPFRREMAYRLLNIVEDAAVERLGCAAYRGLFRRALAFSNHVAFSQMSPIDAMARRGVPAFQVLSQATLMQAVLGQVKGQWLDASLAAVFAKVVPVLEEGKRAPDSMGRLRCAEALYEMYLPWIEEMERTGLMFDDAFPWIKPIWRLSQDRRGGPFFPGGSPPLPQSASTPLDVSATQNDAGSDVQPSSFAHGEPLPAGEGWRWDEEIGHRAAQRDRKDAGMPPDLEADEAMHRQAAPADPGRFSSTVDDWVDGAAGASSKAGTAARPKAGGKFSGRKAADDQEVGAADAARYRFHWKWFRFGKKHRPRGNHSRQMVDADAIRQAGPGEETDAAARDLGPDLPSSDGKRDAMPHIGPGDAASAKISGNMGNPQPWRTEETGMAQKETAEEPTIDAIAGANDSHNGAAWDSDLRQVAEALVSVQEAAVQETRAKAAGQSMILSMRRQGERLAGGLHQGIRIFAQRDFTLSQEDREKFLRLEAEIRWLAQSMIRQWQHWLFGGQPVRESGLYSGKLDERRLWRQDTRLFYRRNRMEAGGDLAILLLVDESGSMNESDRWHHAQRACLVLEAVCRACGLPLAVIGHLAVYGQPHAVHHHYLDFGPRPLEQRERLVLLGPKENTREGLSLRYAARYIREAERFGWLPAGQIRPLILSISDGRPVHDADQWTLKGQAAQDDVRAAVRELEREGIHVIGVAIGDEPSAIGDVYPHAVEVRRVEDLPQRLFRTIRQWMETVDLHEG